MDVNQLGIEVLTGKGWRINGGARSQGGGNQYHSEFGRGREWRAKDIDVICFGRILGDGVGD